MTVEWWSIIPFVLMLTSIAVLPLVPATAELWEKFSFQLGLAVVLGLPVAVWFWFAGQQVTVLHSIWEYLQFITLLGALFVISGGIFLTGNLRATPKVNLGFLAIGGVLASFIGTTGAAMLLIRPILNTNKERRHVTHTVIFTILIVANCGGLLTPLGDPPLFLGMLRGVPFAWTFHLFPEWFFVNALLLATYFGLDRKMYAKEDPEAILVDDTNVEKLGVRGGINFLLLAVIVLSVAFAPSINLDAIEAGNATLLQMIPVRELLMLSAAYISFFHTSKQARFEDNQFTWGPILEVAALFFGIFLTMMPALKYLAQIAPRLPLNEVTFFVFTGGLSAVLDNAPTYVTFFEMARTLPGEPRIADVPELYLVSISLGAVFCGAITYIGNGPNFMVKAVAEAYGVEMPSFGGYIGWAVIYLIPSLIAMALVFIVQATWATIAGLVLAALLLGRAAMLARIQHPDEVEAPKQGVDRS